MTTTNFAQAIVDSFKANPTGFDRINIAALEKHVDRKCPHDGDTVTDQYWTGDDSWSRPSILHTNVYCGKCGLLLESEEEV